MRKLKEDEIELRVGTCTNKGFSLLLYKTARVDRQILDEEYGIMNWQCDYKVINDNLYCGIGVYDKEKDDWIWKWDCGTESYTEKEKGEASDSFKRAGFKWGIGTALYTSPFIWHTGDVETKNERYIPKINISQLNVKEIEYKDDKISKLVIERKGVEFFKWEIDDKGDDLISTDEMTAFNLMIIKYEKDPEDVCKYFKIKDVNDMTKKQFAEFKKICEKGSGE